MSSNDRDQRLKNKGDDIRQDREATDRPVVEDRKLSDDERLELFRSTSFQSTLPEVPQKPGWHYCWLTTNNVRDSVMMRQRWGYEPVRASEIPGFEQSYSLTTGQYTGCIGVNEMVLFKLPMRLYEMYMKEAHHDGPLKEEDKLRAVLEVIAEQARAKGADVEVGDGTATLGKGPRRPMFQEIHE